jgi:cell shape-determining protein MreD
MPTLLAIPTLGLLLVLQSAIFSRVTLLHGTSDLVMLALIGWAVQPRVTTAWEWGLMGGILVSVLSALPPAAVLFGYFAVIAIVHLLRKWLWRAPFLATLAAVVAGTLFTHTVDFIALRLSGTAIPLLDALNLVTLPSLLLNLLFAIPIYGLIGDLAKLMYPVKIEM